MIDIDWDNDPELKRLVDALFSNDIQGALRGADAILDRIEAESTWEASSER